MVYNKTPITKIDNKVRDHLIGIVANDGESSDPLAVEAEVFGEGLCKSDAVTVGHEAANSPRVPLGVSRCEALRGCDGDGTTNGNCGR